ncbi:hypothetical protein H920_05840 [Fukomys damarensis]|uniref:Uncharacterized protein n=1 Tax=Fukomys damarensis TaxID=885580 RepID=A0A091EBM1_FUKDA|nr:hypothetical protein H920_05840 [Fukomys damarensis]
MVSLLGASIRSQEYTITKSQCLCNSLSGLQISPNIKPPPGARNEAKTLLQASGYWSFPGLNQCPHGPGRQESLAAPGRCTPEARAASPLCPHCCGSQRPEREQEAGTGSHLQCRGSGPSQILQGQGT